MQLLLMIYICMLHAKYVLIKFFFFSFCMITLFFFHLLFPIIVNFFDYFKNLHR